MPVSYQISGIGALIGALRVLLGRKGDTITGHIIPMIDIAICGQEVDFRGISR